MLWLIIFIALLSFNRSLATKHVPLNNEPYMFRSTVIDLNLNLNLK